jgi:hypothetical protein
LVEDPVRTPLGKPNRGQIPFNSEKHRSFQKANMAKHNFDMPSTITILERP